MHTCALCFRNEKKKRQQGKKKRQYRWERFHRYYRPLISCHHLSRSWMMNHFIDTGYIKEPVWRAALCESVKVSLFLWPAIPPQIEQVHYPCPSSYAGLVKPRTLLAADCHVPQCEPPPPLQKRAKSCEHQRHWRWRPFTLIPRVAHSHTDSLKENVSWIHKLIGSTTNPSSAWLLIQLLCSKNMKWAGQETGMQPWRTTHSGIYTSKGENLINLVISFYMNFVRVWVQLVFRWMQIYLIIFKNKALALLRGSEA